jgi:hypothetical protein
MVGTIEQAVEKGRGAASVPEEKAEEEPAEADAEPVPA